MCGDSLSWEALAAVILSPAFIAMLMKWMLTQYEKRGDQLEEERRYKIQSQIDRIDTLYNNFNKDMNHLKETFAKLDREFAVLNERLKFNYSEIDKLVLAFKGFVENNTKRFEAAELQLKEIGHEVYRIIGKKKG
jgi:hypothetical protein